MNKEKYIKKIEELENKAKIKNLKNRLTECRFDINIADFDDLYEKFDVDKLETRDLNSDFEAYLMDKIDKVDYLPNLTIHIHCPQNLELSDELIKKACVNHFEEKSIFQLHQNHLMLRKWTSGLIGGFFFLGLCLLASNILKYPQFDVKPFCKVLSESFSIIGWVAIWEPACYFLFSKKEDKRKLRNCYILHSAEYIIDRY